MVLDLIDVALADVTQVAGTQGDVAKGNVNAQENGELKMVLKLNVFQNRNVVMMNIP